VGTPEARPLFSVVIPTRNRPELLQDAIGSVLAQNFEDFELLVSNNSEPGMMKARTEEVVRTFQGDARVRYLTPPEPMNMADHWEFATGKARGRYVAILTDRLAMRPSALRVLAETVSTGPELVVFEVRSGYSGSSKLEYTEPFTGKVATLRPREVLADYLRLAAWGGEGMYLNLLPRGLNSVYRSDFAQRVRESCGRLFWPLSPDYTSGFLSLAFAGELVSLDLPLYLCHGDQSNGQNSVIFGIEGAMKPYPGHDPFEGCPERFDTVLNTLVRDFYFIKGVAGDRLEGMDFDPCGYYLSNYREFLLKEQLGSPLDLAAQYRFWERGVAALPAGEQGEVRRGLADLQKIRPRLRKLRVLARAKGWDAYYHELFAVLRRLRAVLKGRPRYDSVLVAARETDHYLNRAC